MVKSQGKQVKIEYTPIRNKKNKKNNLKKEVYTLKDEKKHIPILNKKNNYFFIFYILGCLFLLVFLVIGGILCQI